MQADTRSQQKLSETIERKAMHLSRCISQRNIGPKLAYDREFAELLTLLSPRIRSLTRQYRLDDVAEDAQQAAAIGVHRALGSFDPRKARFITHVTWQIRGELQSLRHRMRPDQRQSARTVAATTVSLNDLGGQVGDHRVFEIVDEAALSETERGASDSMAKALVDRMLDQLQSPSHERVIVCAHLFGSITEHGACDRCTREQNRQVVRRTLRNCAKARVVQRV